RIRVPKNHRSRIERPARARPAGALRSWYRCLMTDRRVHRARRDAEAAAERGDFGRLRVEKRSNEGGEPEQVPGSHPCDACRTPLPGGWHDRLNTTHNCDV